MITLHSIADLQRLGAPVHLAMGFFDGVHLGHRRVIEAASSAPLRGVLTFEQHPLSLLAPQRSPQLLTPCARQKADLLAAAGVSVLLSLRFDAALAALPPRDFLDALLGTGRVAGFSVGRNWRFGAGGAGDAVFLQAYGAEKGIPVAVNDMVEHAGDRVCSSRIRTLVADGDLAGAATMLGHPFAVAGVVEQGQHLARRLGFPTANISIAQPAALPPFGVYIVETEVDGVRYRGVANLGIRPTIDESEKVVRLETHLLDFSGDLYGRYLCMEFRDFIRPERRFGSLNDLRAQIAADIAAAR